MKKKIILYLSLVPLIFSLVLSVIPLTAAFADCDPNYSGDIDTNYDDFDLEDYPISDLQSWYNKTALRSFCSSKGMNYLSYPYYFYIVACEPSGSYYKAHAFYGGINDATFTTSGNYIILQFKKGWVRNKYLNSDFTESNTTLNDSVFSDYYIYYNTVTGDFRYNYGNSSNPSAQSQGYTIYAETNIEDFPFSDITHTHGTGQNLNVSVSFTPALSGTVNTSINSNGVTVDSNYFTMNVTNNSRCDIQYFMAITDQNHSVFSGSSGVYNSYGDSVKFVYSCNEWIDYVTEYDAFDDSNNEYISVLRRSEWHKCSSNDTVSHSFAWSQMSLSKNTNYDVVVYAYPLNSLSGNVSTLHEYPRFAWESVQEVYRSTFNLSKSTSYNPNDDSFGNFANQSGDTMNHAQHSAYVDENGEVVFAGDGRYFSHEDITNHLRQGSSYTSSNSTINSDFSTLSANFTSFFQFFNRVFSFFPRSYQAIITCGLTSIIVLGVLKVVIR